MEQVREELSKINLMNQPYNGQLPLTPLHWIIASREGSVTVEPVKEGLTVYDNPVGVLTNSPEFPFHMTYLTNYMNLSADPPVNRFSKKLTLEPYSRGMGAMGLPGDLSSASRFVKASFTKMNSCCGPTEDANVSQFFHILGSVEQQRGCVRMPDGKYEITIYSSCCNADKGIYYYTSYQNSRISAVDMHREDLDGREPVSYPMLLEQSIKMQN